MAESDWVVMPLPQEGEDPAKAKADKKLMANAPDVKEPRQGDLNADAPQSADGWVTVHDETAAVPQEPPKAEPVPEPAPAAIESPGKALFDALPGAAKAVGHVGSEALKSAIYPSATDDLSAPSERFLHGAIAPPVAAARETVVNPVVDHLIGWKSALDATTANWMQTQADKYAALGQQDPHYLQQAQALSQAAQELRGSGPAENMLIRQSLSWLTGDDATQLDHMPDAEKSAAVNYLESKFGITGAAFAQGAAKTAGETVPFILFGTGAATREAAAAASQAIPEATTLQRLLAHGKQIAMAATKGAAENLLIGGVQRATHEDEAIFDAKAMATDAAMGGGIAGAAAGTAFAAGEAAQITANAKRKAYDAIANKIDQLRTSRAGQASSIAYATPEGIQPVLEQIHTTPDAEIAKLSDPNFKPTLAVLGELSNGKMGYTLHEANIDGTQRKYELKTERLSEVSKILKEKGVKTVTSNQDYILRTADELEANNEADRKLRKDKMVQGLKAAASGDATAAATPTSRLGKPDRGAGIHEVAGSMQIIPHTGGPELGLLRPGDAVHIVDDKGGTAGGQFKAQRGNSLLVRFYDGTERLVPRSAVAAASEHVGNAARALPPTAEAVLGHPRLMSYIAGNEHITPDSMARIEGMSHMDATNNVAALEDAGWLTYNKDGTWAWDPKGQAQERYAKAWAEELGLKGGARTPDNAGPFIDPSTSNYRVGDPVFTGRTTGEGAETGIIVGKGADNTYKIKVREAGDGLPAEYVNQPATAVAPTHIAQDRGFRLTPSQIAELDATQVLDYDAEMFKRAKMYADAQAKQQPGKVSQFLDKAYDYFSTPFSDRDPAAQVAKLQLLAVQNRANTEAWLQRLTAGAGGRKATFSEMQQDLSKFLKSKMQFEDLLAKYGPAFQDYYDTTVAPAIRLANQNEARLMDLGKVSPDSVAEQIAAGHHKSYAAQRYAVHDLPKGEAAQHIPAEVVNQAIDAIGAELRAQRIPLSADKLFNEVTSILRSDNVEKAIQNSTTSSGKAFQRLLKRSNLPEWMKSAMGEVNSFAYQMAHSLASQEQLLAHLEATDAIVSHREMGSDGASYNPWWSPGRTDLHTVQVENNPNKYGKMAGGYVTKSWKPLLNAMEATSSPMDWAHKVTNMVKYNWTVGGGVKTALRDYLQNMYQSAIVGGLDFHDPVRSARALKDGFAAISQFEHDPFPSRIGNEVNAPTKKQHLTDIVREAQTVGALTEGHQSQDLNLSKNRKVKDALIRHLKDVDESGGVLEVMKGVWDATKDSGFKAAEVRDYMDRAMRMANYISLKEKYLQAAVDSGRPNANQWAAETAAKHLNDLYPNPQFVSDFIRSTRKSLMPLFLTYPMELARTHGNFLASLTEGMGSRDASGSLAPELTDRAKEAWGRLAGLGLTLGAIKYGYRQLRLQAGIDDDKAKAILASQSDTTRGYRPHQVIIPFQDANGAYPVLDVSRLTYIGELMRGDPHSQPLARILTNLAITPVQGTPAEQGIRQMIAGAGGPSAPDQSMFKPHPDASALATAVNTAMNVAPGAVAGLYRDNQPKGPNSQPLTPGMIAARQIVDVAPVGDKTKLGAVKGVKKATSMDLHQQLRWIAQQPFDMERKQMLMDIAIEHARQEVGHLQDMNPPEKK